MAEAAVANVPAKAESGEPKKPLLGLSFLENLAEMSVLRQLGLLVGLAASVAIGFAVVLWSQQPDYRPLYGSLNGMDATQVVETLTASGIDYTIEPNSGALLVKADDLARARMRLAAAGVAPTDNSVGFEILDREQGLGTSQFMEATRYRRGLEGELARTVASLNNVKAARVHLAMPKASVFVRDERKPSASVLVELYPGRALEPSQVMAIVNLVATSVPELDKGQVTVVDQKGNLLSDQQELSELSMAGKQFDYTRRMETLFTQRVHNILQPVLGTGRYKAEVSADVDFSSVESTSEMFNPDQPALRSEQQVNEQRQSSLPPQGVPGALSNQPPGPAAAPQQAAGAAAPAGPIAAGQPLVDANGQQIMDPATGQPMLAPYPADKREQSTRNFELDRSISYTRQQQGRLRRLSVAVVVDDQLRVDPATGESSRVPWTADDLARFTRLVQDSVGFDASRGDSVSVINTAFTASMGEEIPDIPFYTQPWFWDIVKQVLGVLFILVLVFGVLRPVLNNITGGGRGKELAGSGDVELGSMAGLDGELSDDRVSLGGPQSIMLPRSSEGYDAQLNAIKSLVAEDPGRVAQVVKEWINADE
ncbi:flagellar basal-body MS-ring/collar protein FliF [Pseudomonas chengduensis]|uniref:Flagellar M-ring protein n=1 Tax=Ectopseudomonas chengduensis TaxID=489632 RepID=A0A1G6NJB4_9GAMM|nr:MULTISPECIES: flagellar basal-body MS-ring/collar protein FliF [Pseudomonas]KQO31157.1 flagellar M-ring protein FliF [Pseudomonas sp. Leaf83]MBP3061741.1 flagellar basal body M-ring protein FliF [Pseudomonas chengduensis]MDH0957807.1 flagellar basal-body MS-ring/collar protein FliF [Pseudomonas chengduensis]MDH1535091.1 flagellar basal-body MS-ring/collar protein FliF [Pseudomonas chengduensis]NNB74746.1 flagellar basal body M-ring protein FliF [Pseudomonas chengduensis]